MTSTVRILKGTYANKPVENEVFTLVRPISHGKKGMFVTVDGTQLTGDPARNCRVLIESEDDVIIEGEHVSEAAEPVVEETDAEAMDRIRKRFEILDTMTNAVADDVVRGLVISGPPGVGKSHGVEQILDLYEAQKKMEGHKGEPLTEVVKGSMTLMGLYQTLYHNSSKGNIVVFDDCDSILFDEPCLNMLKAVLDTGKKRVISWKADSNTLRREGIPDTFEFQGAVIFITNLDFENVSSKRIKPHLEAVMSRCHYIDLEMNSMRDRFLRIEQIVADGMLAEYKFGAEGERELVEFMKENGKRLREVSLRMVKKIADLKKMSDNWQELAAATCMKRG